MKRAIIGNCCLEIDYEGDGEGFAFNDPKAVSLVLPDGDIFPLTGACGNDIKAHVWVSGGWLYRAESIEDVLE